jgi:hypothetical protein
MISSSSTAMFRENPSVILTLPHVSVVSVTTRTLSLWYHRIGDSHLGDQCTVCSRYAVSLLKTNSFIFQRRKTAIPTEGIRSEKCTVQDRPPATSDNYLSGGKRKTAFAETNVNYHVINPPIGPPLSHFSPVHHIKP